MKANNFTKTFMDIKQCILIFLQYSSALGCALGQAVPFSETMVRHTHVRGEGESTFEFICQRELSTSLYTLFEFWHLFFRGNPPGNPVIN